MIVRIAHRQRGFTQIANDTLRDTRLTWKARGVLAFLLSHPDDATLTAEDLTEVGPDGKAAVRAAFEELRVAGYLVRDRSQGDDGRWRTELTVYERPKLISENRTTPRTENQPSVPPAETDEPDGRTEGRKTERRSIGSQGLRLNPEDSRAEDEVLSPPKSAIRRQDPIWDALVHVFGDPTTSVERTRIGKARRELAAAGATGEEVVDRAREGWRRWDGQPFGPEALVKWWTSLASPAPPRRKGNGVGGANLSRPGQAVAEWERLRFGREERDGSRRVAADRAGPLHGLPEHGSGA